MEDFSSSQNISLIWIFSAKFRRGKKKIETFEGEREWNYRLIEIDKKNYNILGTSIEVLDI